MTWNLIEGMETLLHAPVGRIPVAKAPTLVGMAGSLYFAGALILTLMFVGLAIRFGLSRTIPDARRLFFGSILYLPLSWMLRIADRV